MIVLYSGFPTASIQTFFIWKCS